MARDNSLLAELLAPEKGTILADLLEKVDRLENDIFVATNDEYTLLRVKEALRILTSNIDAQLAERKKR